MVQILHGNFPKKLVFPFFNGVNIGEKEICFLAGTKAV
uniref:Uncharacterized protein n=1 Tax=Arundo donax TaxID=35708 RepID=A0A0A8ZEG7_ARUDO